MRKLPEIPFLSLFPSLQHPLQSIDLQQWQIDLFLEDVKVAQPRLYVHFSIVYEEPPLIDLYLQAAARATSRSRGRDPLVCMAVYLIVHCLNTIFRSLLVVEEQETFFPLLNAPDLIRLI